MTCMVLPIMMSLAGNTGLIPVTKANKSVKYRLSLAQMLGDGLQCLLTRPVSLVLRFCLVLLVNGYPTRSGAYPLRQSLLSERRFAVSTLPPAHVALLIAARSVASAVLVASKYLLIAS